MRLQERLKISGSGKALSRNKLSSEAQQPGADRERARSDQPSRSTGAEFAQRK